MGRLIVFENVTLDGVMQAPGRPDEDTRDGFCHGGWAAPYADPSLGAKIGKQSADPGPLLLGRRTYEDFASVWPRMPADNPFTELINKQRKYVASTTLREPLAWNNSVLLRGDAMPAVSSLKAEENADIVVLGSGELVLSLMRHNLVDEFHLLIHPLILGRGRRLFAEGSPYTTLLPISSVTTATGVIFATFRPVSPAEA